MDYRALLIVLFIYLNSISHLEAKFPNHKKFGVNGQMRLPFTFGDDLKTGASGDCPNAPAEPADRRINKANLRVVSFNAEWLFDSGKSCPGTGCPWEDQTEAEEHLSMIAQVISDLDADIVNLEEVEDCEVLKKLISLVDSQNLLKKQKMVADTLYLPYLVKGTDTATGQNVGIITKVDPFTNMQRTEARVNYPLPGSKCDAVANRTIFSGLLKAQSSGVSKHYYTKFQVQAGNGTAKITIVLIGLHFLAIPDDPSRCFQREAQATVIHDLVEEQVFSQGLKNVIVLGDYNDYDPSVSDPAGDVPISQVLPIIKNQRKPLYNIAQNVTNVANRWSCWYDKNNNCKDDGSKEHTLIDHILISDDMRSMVSSVSFYHGYPAQCSFYSDHYPVILDLKLV